MKYRKNEKGAALLLALGFAALMLVLIMGFATNSLIERKVASTAADRTETKAIAMGALKRSVAAMEYLISLNNIHDSGIYRFDNIVSKNNEVYGSEVDNQRLAASMIDSLFSYGSNLDDDDYWRFDGMQDVFTKEIGNVLNSPRRTDYGLKYGKDLYIYKYPLAFRTLSHYFDYNENCNNNLEQSAVTERDIQMRQPQWQYVRGANNEITGRFLYAVLPDMGKIPMSAFSSVTNDNPNPNSNIDNKGRTISDFANTFSEFRQAYAGSGSKVVEGFDEILRPDIKNETSGDTPIEVLENGKNWDYKKKLRSMLAFYALNMVEPLNSNSNLNENFRQGTNYRTGSTSPILRLFQGSSTNVTLHPDFSSNVTALKNAVPYLNKIDSNETVRNQIAANIVQFFRHSGNILSHNNEFTNTTTYTGNRFTPYINEFTLSISNLVSDRVVVAYDENDPTKINTKIEDVDVTFGANVELFNIYGESFDPGANDTITFTGDITIEFALLNEGAPLGSPKTVTLSVKLIKDSAVAWTSPVELKFPDTADGNVFRLSSINALVRDSSVSPVTLNLEYSGEKKCQLQAKITSISNGMIKYSRINNGAEEILDFVNNISVNFTDDGMRPKASSVELNIGATALGSITPETELVGQAIDPFCNLNANDIDPEVRMWNYSSSNTIGASNSSMNISEIIRNNVPRLQKIASDLTSSPVNYNNISLADFGFISRGRPGQTLNIHSLGVQDTNSIAGTVNDILVIAAPTTNPATFADGGLLDQITTMVDSSPQLIDINTRSVSIWKSLLSNIKGDVIGDTTPENILNATQAENLARKISWRLCNSSNREFFKSRSGFIAVFNASLGAVNGFPETISNITGVALSDREKQIIIGKMLPLCKTEDYPEFVQVIVVAQKIKDIGGMNDGSFEVGDNFGSYEHGRDKIVSEVRLLAKLRRTGNTIKIISIEELMD